MHTSTLQGAFSFIDTGVIISPPAAAGPTASVLALTFDGIGSITSAVGSGSLNGNIGAQTESGTYTVNPR